LKTILHLDMDAYFASVEQRDHPIYRGQPLMVCHTDSVEGYNGVVAAASYEARPYGVKSGMSVLEAKKLCPRGVYVPGNYHKYLHNTKEIVRNCRTFTDEVEVFSIDEMWLDITKTKRFFGGDAARVAYLLRERIRRNLGLSCSIGIGPNKLTAKMAGEFHKPGGVTIIRPEDLPEILAPLPVGDLFGVGRQMEKKLGLIGVTTIGELAEVPEDYLRKRFGIVGLYLKEASLGLGDSALVSGRSGVSGLVKSFGHSAALGSGEADIDKLCQILLGLCDGVTRRMRRDRYAGRTVVIKLRLARLFGFTRSRTVPRTLDLTEQVYPLARELLLAERDVLAKYPATLIGISVTNLIHGWRQLSIYDPADDRQARATAAVDKIKDKYGSRIITRASLLNWKRRYHAVPLYGGSGVDGRRG
jgi:DNA polymerase-4